MFQHQLQWESCENWELSMELPARIFWTISFPTLLQPPPLFQAMTLQHFAWPSDLTASVAATPCESVQDLHELASKCLKCVRFKFQTKAGSNRSGLPAVQAPPGQSAVLQRLGQGRACRCAAQGSWKCVRMSAGFFQGGVGNGHGRIMVESWYTGLKDWNERIRRPDYARNNAQPFCPPGHCRCRQTAIPKCKHSHFHPQSASCSANHWKTWNGFVERMLRNDTIDFADHVACPNCCAKCAAPEQGP